jgi:aryl-phospho-beta-D-glucosidase BglC (GH1 family)
MYSETAGSSALQGFTEWARSLGFKAFIGEFAGTYTDPVCVKAIPDMLNFVINNQDVFVGWYCILFEVF